MISVIFPLLNEQDNIRPVYNRIAETTSLIPGEEFEFIFVDDGSTDASPKILETLRAEDSRVHTIRFPRNFGSHSAVAAALKFARGDAAIILACDAQDPPELVPQLIDRWRAGYKAVWGSRNARPIETPALRFCSNAYYSILKYLTGIALPKNGVDVGLIDRSVIDIVNQCDEKNSSYVLLIYWMGVRQCSIGFDKAERGSGSSKWNTAKRIKLLIDSVVSFSYIPLRAMSCLGICASAFGIFYGAVILLNALFGRPVEGWTSLMVVVLCFGGFQMLMLGVLGEYVWRAFAASRKLPAYVIEQNTITAQPAAKNSATKKRAAKKKSADVSRPSASL